MKSFKGRVLLGLLIMMGSMILFISASYIAFYYIIQDEAYTSIKKDMTLLMEEIDSIFIAHDALSFSIQQSPAFEKINKNLPLSMYEASLLQEDIARLLAGYENHIQNIIVYPRASDYLVTSSGSALKYDFFDIFYVNDRYNYKFWQSQFQEEYSTQYLQSSIFTENTKIKTNNQSILMPVVTKSRYNSTFLIIFLISRESLEEELDFPLSNTLSVVSPHGTVISDDLSEKSYADYEALLSNENEFVNEYQYIRQSEETGLIYSDYTTRQELNETLFSTYALPFLLTALGFIVGSLLAYVIVQYISKPIKNLRDSLEKLSISDNKQNNDIEFIKTGVDSILSQNTIFSKEIEEKRNQIVEFTYLSQLKKLYQQDATKPIIDEEYSTHLLVYVKVHNTNYSKIEALKSEIKDFFEGKITTKYILIMDTSELIIDFDIEKAEKKPILIDNLSEFFEKEKKDFCFTIVCGDPYTSENFSANMYTELVKMSTFTYLTEQTQILETSCESAKKGIFIYFTAAERKTLYDHIFRCDKENILSMLLSLLEQNKEKNVKNHYLQLASLRITNFCLNAMQDANNGVSFDIDLESLMTRISNYYYYDDYKQGAEKLVAMVTENMPNTETEKQDPVIIKIKKYVSDNYQNNFSIEQIADDIYISRSYISTYFKEKTNVNLSTYITNFRIMKSLALLKETNLSVQEICDAVGIFNINTFIRLFKKYMGTTPGNYRREI